MLDDLELPDAPDGIRDSGLRIRYSQHNFEYKKRGQASAITRHATTGKRWIESTAGRCALPRQARDGDRYRKRQANMLLEKVQRRVLEGHFVYEVRYAPQEFCGLDLLVQTDQRHLIRSFMTWLKQIGVVLIYFKLEDAALLPGETYRPHFHAIVQARWWPQRCSGNGGWIRRATLDVQARHKTTAEKVTAWGALWYWAKPSLAGVRTEYQSASTFKSGIGREYAEYVYYACQRYRAASRRLGKKQLPQVRKWS